MSFFSIEGYVAQKVSRKKDKFHGSTYYKFLNVGANVGINAENNKKKNVINFDASIFEFGYYNDYFSISFSAGFDPVDISIDIFNIVNLFV